MATLELTRTNLKIRLADRMGYSRESTQWTPTQEARLNEWIDSGYRLVLFPEPVKGGGRHAWSFLWPETTLTLSEPYTTGTITVVAGVVTMVGGTFPTWAAQGDLTPEGEGTYSVATRDGANQITLDDTTVAVAAGTSYSLGRAEYELPCDFGGFQGPMVYEAGESGLYAPIRLTSWAVIRRYLQINGGSTDRPTEACLLPTEPDATASQTWKLIFNCRTNGAYTLNYRYKVNLDALDATNIYAAGGPALSRLMLAACFYCALQEVGDDPSQLAAARNEYLVALNAAIADDEGMAPERMAWGTEDYPYFSRHQNDGVYPTYEGVRYY